MGVTGESMNHITHKMKNILFGWLEKLAPSLWLLYIHKNQFFNFLSDPCENELFNISKIPINSKGVAIDIGANIGAYSFAFSKRVGFREVLSIEPDQSLHSYITKIPNVKLIKEAISNEDSISVFSVPLIEGIALKSRSTLSKYALKSFNEIKSYEVKCISLDHLIEKNGIDPSTVGIVKIDVEGHEFDSLSGGSKFLKLTGATLLIEIELRHHVDGHVDHIFEFLRKFDYVPFYLSPYDLTLKKVELQKIQEMQLKENIATNAYINNFIFRKIES